jgi:hypothetical protein
VDDRSICANEPCLGRAPRDCPDCDHNHNYQSRDHRDHVDVPSIRVSMSLSENLCSRISHTQDGPIKEGAGTWRQADELLVATW